MKDEDIETLYKNVDLWQYSQEAPLSPTLTNGKLSTLDLRHLAWNIGERLKWPGEERAFFIKQSFPHEFRDLEIKSQTSLETQTFLPSVETSDSKETVS